MKNFKRFFLLFLIPFIIGILCIISAQLLSVGKYYSASFGIFLSQVLIAYGFSDALYKINQKFLSIQQRRKTDVV
jgi:hypothetical protein